MLERPLIIVSAAGLIFANLRSMEFGYLVALFTALLIFLNMVFAYNRYVSSSRIIAYVILMHERRAYQWLGWETSLFLWRNHFKGNDPEKPKADITLWVTSIIEGKTTLINVYVMIGALSTCVISFLWHLMHAFDIQNFESTTILGLVGATASSVLIAILIVYAVKEWLTPPMGSFVQHYIDHWREVFESPETNHAV